MNPFDERGESRQTEESTVATQELRRLKRDREGQLRDQRPKSAWPPTGSGVPAAVAQEAGMSAKKPGFATTGYIGHCDGSFYASRGSVAFRGLGPPAGSVYVTSSLKITCVKNRQRIVRANSRKRSIS